MLTWTIVNEKAWKVAAKVIGRKAGNKVLRVQGNKIKPQEGSAMASTGTRKIKVLQGEENQSRDKVDRVRILAKVTVRVACDEMLIGEDHQMKEQKNNSREVQVSSQQEGCKTQQEMDVYNPSTREKDVRQGNGVKSKGELQEDGGGWFNRSQQADGQ